MFLAALILSSCGTASLSSMADKSDLLADSSSPKTAKLTVVDSSGTFESVFSEKLQTNGMETLKDISVFVDFFSSDGVIGCSFSTIDCLSPYDDWCFMVSFSSPKEVIKARISRKKFTLSGVEYDYVVNYGSSNCGVSTCDDGEARPS